MFKCTSHVIYQCIAVAVVVSSHVGSIAAFVLPGLSTTRAKHYGLSCSAEQNSEITKPDAVGRALKQAAKLRQEIAALEQDLNKGKSASVRKDEPPPVESERPTSPFSLAPTRWLVHMDIGREKGTWMPQSWGISGRRLEIDLLVQFMPGGDMTVNVASPFVDMKVRPGIWKVGPLEGNSRRRTNQKSGNLSVISDTCRFWVETDGFSRGDVSIPPGRVYFAVPAWGGKLSRKGLVTVRQKRWLIREESRILGIFGTERIDADANGQMPTGVPRPRLPPFASGFKA